MSDFSRTNCDNHEESNPLTQPLSSTYFNIENGKTTGGDGIEDSEPIVPADILTRKEIEVAQSAKAATFPPSAPTTAMDTPLRTSLLSRLVRCFQSIKAEVKAKKPFTRCSLGNRNSCDAPAPEHPGPPTRYAKLPRITDAPLIIITTYSADEATTWWWRGEDYEN
ncbi:hypothetical protein FIBSPDRAFT_859573 [Athelia psychrophila]|uniref:Uncharacterized protein n=1 Tax=Athelia psychrophila TaxID=1759441 RepID=A0A166KV33_9AGAM|nr:hypothetical protein FIBSPDRAFT_859573 [Fibularhizoctonia sp. CBS 109695]